MHINAAVLGMLQGLTEFLPVSSSGHLVAAQHLLGLTKPQLLFDVILHAATALVVLIYYRRPIGAICRDALSQLNPGGRMLPGSRLLLLLVAGNAVTVAFYLVFKDPVRFAFGSPRAVGIALVVNALVLLSSLWARALQARWRPQRGATTAIDMHMAMIAGLAQGLALTPGISRSGLTIVVLLLLGCRREKAVEFSMLLALPAICGALCLELAGGTVMAMPFTAVVLGFAAAFVTGLLALHFLVLVTKGGRLYLFAPYCLIVGALLVVLSIG